MDEEEYFYEDELKRLFEEFGELYDFTEAELISDLGTCKVFIYNFTVYILN